MPQRTNDFQSLMYLIQSQLAPTSARVEQSAYLTDKAIDSDREIDILITDPRGNLPPQTIAIECRDRKRKGRCRMDRCDNRQVLLRSAFAG